MTRLPAVVGLLGMALGALAVGLRGRGRAGWLPLVALALPLSSGTWYLAAALDQAVLVRPAGPVYWGRYADGVVTLPLLVVGLGLAAGADRRALVAGAGLAAWTMATTLAATLSTGVATVAWLVPSVGGFVALVWVVFGPLVRGAGERAGGPESGPAGDRRPGPTPPASTPALAPRRSVRRLRAYVVGLWLLYPVLWALGPAGFALAPDLPLAWPGVALDLLLKPGTGLLLLRWTA
ncbi:MAG: bacteriorhodopsin [Haloferacaceae archaeon]